MLASILATSAELESRHAIKRKNCYFLVAIKLKSNVANPKAHNIYLLFSVKSSVKETMAVDTLAPILAINANLKRNRACKTN